MGDIYHKLPNLLITNGLNVTEHKLYLVSNPEPDLLLESRIGLFGELIRRCYKIEPPLPKTFGDPLPLLDQLIASLKVLNYSDDLDMWVHRVTLRMPGSEEPVSVNVQVEPWELMLHEVSDVKRLCFDITPPEPSNSNKQ